MQYATNTANCSILLAHFAFKEMKMKIVSSFTHPHVVPNLYEFLSSAEHKKRYFEEC